MPHSSVKHVLKVFIQSKQRNIMTVLQHSTVDVSVKCSICEKVLASKMCLKTHMKYVHSEERVHSCNRCDVKFKHKKDLKNHTLYVHNNNLYEETYLQPKDVKRFNCEQCTSSYTHKKALNARIQISIQKTKLFRFVIYALCSSKRKRVWLHTQRKT